MGNGNQRNGGTQTQRCTGKRKYGKNEMKGPGDKVTITCKRRWMMEASGRGEVDGRKREKSTRGRLKNMS